jgi:outer membrane protein OmpU
MNVALSFTLDHGDGAHTGGAGFDSHSVSVGSDVMGTITFAGDGASAAVDTIDTTAAGDIWNNSFTYTAPTSAIGDTKTLMWALPTFVDGLAANVSYTGAATGRDSDVSYALTYSGIEGASISYGFGTTGGTDSSKESEVTVMKASFAFGPITAAMSINDYGAGAAENTAAQEQSSYKLSYSVSDELSISYGSETHETTGQTYDEEFQQVSVAYTSGGLTVSASQTEAEGMGSSTKEESMWNLGLSFAF